MHIPNRLTRKQAQDAGFTVDTLCYPWFGYRGPRFNPTEKCEVFTDLEAGLIATNKQAEKSDKLYTDLLVDDVERLRFALGQQKFVDDAYLTIRDRLLTLLPVVPGLLLYGPGEIELDSGDSDMPRVSMIFKRELGKNDKGLFVSEVRLVVTPETCYVEAVVLVVGHRPYQRYDEHTFYALEPNFLCQVGDLLQGALRIAGQQSAYVVGKEGLPETV